MSDALIIRGGLLTFSQSYFRIAVENKYLHTTEAKHSAHGRLALYFEFAPLPVHFGTDGSIHIDEEAAVTSRALDEELYLANNDGTDARELFRFIPASAPWPEEGSSDESCCSVLISPDGKKSVIFNIINGEREGLSPDDRWIVYCNEEADESGAPGPWFRALDRDTDENIDLSKLPVDQKEMRRMKTRLNELMDPSRQTTAHARQHHAAIRAMIDEVMGIEDV